MRLATGLGLALLALALTAVAAAQQPAPAAAFRFERGVTTGGAGPRRLAIDVPLLARTRPVDMSGGGTLPDLRLFDPSGREVPFLFVTNPSPEPVWTSAATLPIAPVETQTQKTSGFEIDLGQAMTVDRFRVDGVSPPFLKRVTVEGSGDRSRWTLLVAEGTIFDLPNDKLRQVELAFTAGSYRYLRLTWDDSRSGRLPQPPRAAARQVPSGVRPPPLTASLTFERRPGEPGRSHFRVRLPAARLPIAALDLDVAPGHLLREAEVFEARLAGAEVVPVRLGSATLTRVEEGGVSAASLRIPIDRPNEAQLDLVVEDGSNPPIDLRGVAAVFSELPWIYFESPGDAVVARYGHPTVQAPRYDLEAARKTLDVDKALDASWGEPRANTTEGAAAPPPSLPTLGAPLDATRFRYSRPIAPGDAGLVILPLDAAVLAHSRGPSFADVRVIDGASRQVPYLVERASEPLSIDLTIERSATRPPALPADRQVSVYRVRWPLEGLPAPRLVLTTSARVFTRQVVVSVEREPDRSQREPWLETLNTGRWGHAEQDTPAPELTISLGDVRAKEVMVIVDDGDNSPLPVTAARLLLPSYKLRLFREQGTALRLAYGRDDLAPPRYDLALLAPQLIGVAATEVVAGAEQAPAPESVSVLMSPWLFWGVMGVAVVVLLALVARLVMQS